MAGHDNPPGKMKSTIVVNDKNMLNQNATYIHRGVHLSLERFLSKLLQFWISQCNCGLLNLYKSIRRYASTSDVAWNI